MCAAGEASASQGRRKLDNERLALLKRVAPAFIILDFRCATPSAAIGGQRCLVAVIFFLVLPIPKKSLDMAGACLVSIRTGPVKHYRHAGHTLCLM